MKVMTIVVVNLLMNFSFLHTCFAKLIYCYFANLILNYYYPSALASEYLMVIRYSTLISSVFYFIRSPLINFLGSH